MFSGIIEEIGKIDKINIGSTGRNITIQAESILDELKIGDSVAVNGTCTTVEKIADNKFTVFLSAETISKTAFNYSVEKELVNLERALKLSDRLGGHLVSGHVDATGEITSLYKEGDSFILEITSPSQYSHLIVNKGSICIDGISLTIADIKNNIVKSAIIPHTFNSTILKFKKNGDKVNLEYDIIGKYLYRFFEESKKSGNKITEDFLRNKGFY